MTAASNARAVQERYLVHNQRITIPVDPLIVLRRLGVEVTETDMETNTPAAVYVPDGDSAARIVVDKGLTSSWLRVILAHSLGCVDYALTKGHEPFGVIQTFSTLTAQDRPIHSTWAHHYAAQLLTPPHALAFYWTINPDIDRLAAIFDVPRWFLRNRIAELELN